MHAGLGLLGLAGMTVAGCRQPAAAGLERVALEELRPVAGLRPLAPEIWGRRAVAYSGYRHGQSPETGVYPERAEVLEDLRLLEGRGFGLLRVFGSGTHGRDVVELIAEHGLDLKVQVGAYVRGAHAANGESNLHEVDEAIALANAYPDIVVGLSVGNEVLVSWSFVAVPPEDLAAYIRHARARVRQPVTVNDNWEPYAAGPGDPARKVWGQIDYASVHTYAYWDAGFNLWPFEQEAVPEARRARAMMGAAAAYARANFAAVRAALDAAGLAIPIVIGETGWQSVPSATLDEARVRDWARHLGHPVNQSWYYQDMLAWAHGADGATPGDGFTRPAALFYFAAFDEPWKNADDNWGLWDAARAEKHALSGRGVDPADAVFYRPPQP